MFCFLVILKLASKISTYKQGCGVVGIFSDSNSDSRAFKKTTLTSFKNVGLRDSDSTTLIKSHFKNVKKKVKADPLFKICSLSCIMLRFDISSSKKCLIKISEQSTLNYKSQNKTKKF